MSTFLHCNNKPIETCISGLLGFTYTIVLYCRTYLIVPGKTFRQTFHPVSKQNSTEAAHFQCLRHHNLL